MVRDMAFLLLSCLALVSASEECSDNCAAKGSVLLQTKSSEDKVSVYEHDASLLDLALEDIAALAKEKQIPIGDLELITAEIKAHKNEPVGEAWDALHARQESQVWHYLTAKEGENMSVLGSNPGLKEFLLRNPQLREFFHEKNATDGLCQQAYANNPEAGTPQGCNKVDVAPKAVQSCEGKTAGEKCEFVFGIISSSHRSSIKITSICADQYDGAMTCLPYMHAWCVYPDPNFVANSGAPRSLYYPDGYYCTSEQGGGNWVLGTCQDNPNKDSMASWGKKTCNGELHYKKSEQSN